ncbi:MAG: YitT family protein [Eubacteriales bacterium]|nr:YitT family protein [Eubacteriales bacterium]
MNSTKNINKRIWELLCVVMGNIIYALTVKLFLLPAGLIAGGTTGIALVVNRLTGMQISAFVFAFNILMLIVGLLMLGKSFALTTLASTFLYPAFLNVFDRILGDFCLTDDIVLCTVFAGLGVGIALGMVLRSGASTGGMDIPPLVLRKLFRIPVSASMYVFDVLILLAQAVYQPADRLLYAIIFVLIYTVVLDKMMIMGSSRTEVKIVSEHIEEIRTSILKNVDRGLTMLDGEGGYERKEMQMIFTVISNRELPRLEKMIHEIDPECFMVISRVSEVSGRGFSLSKDYKAIDIEK